MRAAIAQIECLEPRAYLAATPYISELLASNKDGLRDSFGEVVDWIELHNPDSRESVDLANWKLKYKNTVWTFPPMNLGPSEFRVVFATGRNLVDPNDELHTSFNLDKSGANLSLLDPADMVVQEFAPYPSQQTDVSYGVGQQITETRFVSVGNTARHLVPTSNSLSLNWIQKSFSDASWSSGPTGLGFANSVPGIAVANYKASLGSVASLAQAQSVIDNPANQTWVQRETAPYIDYLNTGGGGNFTNNRTFPGLTVNTDADQHVVRATGLVRVPTAGTWTFGVSSDDGFSLTVGGQSIAFDGLRGADNTLGTFTFAAAGDYDLSLLFFENGGGSGLELFAAQGNKTAFDSTFRLVGDTARGGLAMTSTPFTGSSNSSTFASLVRTNVKAAMQTANNASLYSRIKFDVADLASLQTLTLRMKYDDGYVAYINGVEVARKNAPASVAWNSAASAARASDLQATTFEAVDLTAHIGLLSATGNVLAIQAMNVSASDTDLLIAPELVQVVSTQLGSRFFSTPTPGAANTIDTWQPDLTFSAEHGFYEDPFALTLTTTMPGASIYYTLDGSAPGPSLGTLYTGPINIADTTILRAVATVSATQLGVSSTQTYLFLNSVIGQPSQPAGFPAAWGTEPADYEMDRRITTDPTYSTTIKQSLLSIPTMSIVTDQTGFFDAATGIYANPTTPDWERATSLEYFDADGDDGFQINAGMRIYGGYGRNPQFKKHSIRFIFKQEYGPTKLSYDLFGDGASTDLDTLILRANFNDSWTAGDQRTQFTRDQFLRLSLQEMGQPASHGTFVHLYINGLYWGLYNPTERPDSRFAASYLGGEPEDWEGTNAGEPINSGSLDAWNALLNYFGTYDVSTTAGYQRLQGNNPDGTRNPAYENLLDVNNYIDYLLANFFIGNNDWPGHNYYAGRMSGPDSTGFKSFPWDSEMSLDGGWSSLYTDTTGSGSANNDIGKPYYYLRNNADFRMLFADHVQRHLFNDGALSPSATVARYDELARRVEAAVVGESARWGDVATGGGPKPATQAIWRNERDYLLNTYLPQRTAIVIQQLRNAGLFPAIDAPSFAISGVGQYGGTFLPGDTLTMSAPSGNIYYRMDGLDPRAVGLPRLGGISSVGTTATVVLANHGLANGARILIDSAARAEFNGIFTISNVTANSFTYTIPVMPGAPASGSISIRNVDQAVSTLTLSGTTVTAIVPGHGYANGDILRIVGASALDYSGDFVISNVTPNTFAYTISGTPATPATGVIAAIRLAQRYTAGITLTQGVQVKARAFANGEWSAMADAPFHVDLAPSIRITELMYNPAAPSPEEIAAGHTDNNAFEFIEVGNIGAQTLPLQGLRLSDGVSFTFPNVSLAPGQYLLVVANAAAFQFRYPTVNPSIIAGQYTGLLNSTGEKIDLDAPSGGTVHKFTFNNTWYGPTDGEGFSLTIRDPLQALSLWDRNEGWRSSAALGGTPGYSDTLPLPNSIVINEVLASASGSQGDMIELYNTSSEPIDIGGWFLSDSSLDRAKYRIAVGTTLAAGGYLVLTEAAHFGAAATDPGRLTAFSLSGTGGDVYLASNASGAPGGYRDHVSLEMSPADTSLGRLTKSTGGADFALLATPTFGETPQHQYMGAANSIAWVGPVVMSEIMYHPADVTAAESALGFTNRDDFEFIELYNRSTSPQPLANYYIGDGVGFTFGWIPGGVGGEKRTLESNATATWNVSGLAAGSYELYARISLVGPDGVRRTNLDSMAQYAITHSGGVSGLKVDQNQVGVAGTEAWISLGAYSFDGDASVTLRRGTAFPREWTLADSVRFVRAGEPDTDVSNPTLSSYSIQHGVTTIAPGGYVVLVSNLAAFNARYQISANNIPVAGVYSGNLENNGEWVRLFQLGALTDGVIQQYEAERANYDDNAPWPGEPDGGGPALVRVHPAGYGNDPINWQASNVKGTPGTANIPFDSSAPTIPVNVAGRVTLNPTTITVSWSASQDAQSSVAHYVIYRDGRVIGTATTTSFADEGVVSMTPHSYQVSAVNRDGRESGLSAAAVVTVPGILSVLTADTTRIEIIFTEALNPAAATALGSYIFSGGALMGVSLTQNNTKVVLTTAGAMTPNTSYTLAINGLTTASGNQLPASISKTFTYALLGQGVILREYWTGIGGSSMTDLTGNANYPGSPSGRELMTNFEGPSSWGDNYGDRFRGYVYPPTTGSYIFWISGDDASELWLSTNDNPANAVRIAYVSAWTSSREWMKEANQQSVPITLMAGQKYYVETRHKEGTGGDNIAVRWQLPGGGWETADADAPIPGIRLSPFGGSDPTGPSVPANFSAALVSSTEVRLSWDASTDAESGVDRYVIFRDGAAYGTSTTTSFTDNSGIAPRSRHTYAVSAANSSGLESARSAAITLAPPGVNSVTCASPTSVQVVFSEPVKRLAAETIGNYRISGATVMAAQLAADNLTLILTTSAIPTGQSRTLTITAMGTLSGNAIPASLAETFSYDGQIVWDYWLNVGGGAVSDLTSNANYPNNPSGSEVRASFEARNDWADNYGGRIRGYILPPATGSYTFWIASDDNSELWLSTGEDPANKAMIAHVPGWTPSRSWSVFGQQRSAPVTLVGGKRYYIEALQKEGGGGDNLAVAWQRPGAAMEGPIPGTYLAPYASPAGVVSFIPITINQTGTSDSTPALSGTVGDASAAITVSVNGRYFPAVNRGDGTWALADNIIRPALANGTHQVTVLAVGASGRVGFDSTRDELMVDTIGPAVDISDVTPDPRSTPVSSVQIVFNEPVTGFNIADVHLTLNGGADLITGSETLTTSDNITWTLSGLGGLTTAAGVYLLTIRALGSGVVDAGSNALATDASDTWVLTDSLTIDGDEGGVRDDVIRLARSTSNPAMLDVFVNAGGPTPTYTVEFAGLRHIAVNGLGGSDLLIIDGVNGPVVPADGIAWDGGAGGGSLHVIGAGPAQAIALVSGLPAPGSHAIGYLSTTDIRIANSATTFSDDLGGIALTVGADAAVTFTSTQHLASLHIGAGGRVEVAAAGTALVIGGLSIAGQSGAWQGRLELHQNSLIVRATTQTADAALAAIGNQIHAAAQDSGAEATLGQGITGATSDALFGLAAIVNDSGNGKPIVSILASEPVDVGDVLVKYTLHGDSDLSGVIDAADYMRLDYGLLAGRRTYRFGDFNYDTQVGGDDYFMIDAAFLGQPQASAAPLASPAAMESAASDMEANTAPTPTASSNLSGGFVGAPLSAAPLTRVELSLATTTPVFTVWSTRSILDMNTDADILGADALASSPCA